jgi:hypothetical protein
MNGVLAGIQRPHQSPAERLCEGRAENRAAGREQRALEQNLTQQAAPGSTQRYANGDLAPLCAGACQHQVGEIGTGNQQHEPVIASRISSDELYWSRR